MINTVIFDFAGVILNPPSEENVEGITELHKELFPKDPYYFANHFEINDALLDFLKTKKDKQSLPSSKIKLNFVIFTSMMLKDEPELKEKIDPVFSKIYSAAEMQFRKNDPESFKFILKDLNRTPEEILFIDDSEDNIESAKSLGIKTLLYKNNQEVFDTINSL